MKERTRKFLEQFTNLNNEDFKVSFGDIFTEFIEILNNLDLSDKTLLYINELFNKDMQLFFIKMEIKKKNFISKQKVKEKIEEIKEDKESKYFDTFLMARDINYAIDILKELLEEK